MQGTIEVERFMNWMRRLRKQSEKHALWWYDRCDSEHEKQDVERIFGEVLERALAKRKQAKLPY
jgi:hypothetical protein